MRQTSVVILNGKNNINFNLLKEQVKCLMAYRRVFQKGQLQVNQKVNLGCPDIVNPIYGNFVKLKNLSKRHIFNRSRSYVKVN